MEGTVAYDMNDVLVAAGILSILVALAPRAWNTR
jgi:hypothetical protein